MKIKIKYGVVTKIECIELWDEGDFNVWFDCFKVPILFATRPNWNVGDAIKITFEKVEPCHP
jgi:hypothetical protein